MKQPTVCAGRPSIQGTLDFDRLDLSAYLDTIRPTTTAEEPGDWRFLPVPNVFASPMDIDVRFATREVLTSQFTLGETAGSVLLSDGQMVVGIGESLPMAGQLRGSLTLAQTGDSFTAGIDLSAADCSLDPSCPPFKTTRDFPARWRCRPWLSGEGETLAELLETMVGDAAIGVENTGR
jgi:uncharacterized protein involved in outer membrane biogenesis